MYNVQFSLSCVENAFFSSGSGTKTFAPLLHCSITDTLINQITHCQNVSTKLISILDSTPVGLPISNAAKFAQKIIITVITLVTYNDYLSVFLKVQWLRFTGVMEVVKNCLSFFQDSVCHKSLKSVHLRLSY